jgi:hypothetical protein
VVVVQAGRGGADAFFGGHVLGEGRHGSRCSLLLRVEGATVVTRTATPKLGAALAARRVQPVAAARVDAEVGEAALAAAPGAHLAGDGLPPSEGAQGRRDEVAGRVAGQSGGGDPVGG